MTDHHSRPGQGAAMFRMEQCTRFRTSPHITFAIVSRSLCLVGLKQHLPKNETGDKMNKLKCGFCDKMFAMRCNLKRHMDNDHQKSVCDSVSDSYISMK